MTETGNRGDGDLTKRVGAGGEKGGGDEGEAEGEGGADVVGARQMSYTERAAVHSECRRLVKSIRLAELMLAEACISAATTSATALLAGMRLSTRYGSVCGR